MATFKVGDKVRTKHILMMNVETVVTGVDVTGHYYIPLLGPMIHRGMYQTAIPHPVSGFCVFLEEQLEPILDDHTKTEWYQKLNHPIEEEETV